MKRALVFVLLFCIVFSSFSLAKDVGVEEVDGNDVDIGDTLTSEVSEGLTRYVYGSGLVASVKNSEINYYHSDRMQSNRLIINSRGVVEKEFKSLPFGQEISNSGVRYAFATGKELDSSGLYYFGARYYDSDLGRFTSVDPVKKNEPYSYVRNNPLYFVDPSGMDEEIQQDMNWFEKIVDFFLGLGIKNEVKEEAKVEEKTAPEQLEEDILNSLNSATSTIEEGGIVPCTAGACSVAEASSTSNNEAIVNLLKEPKASKQYINVFGEVAVENGEIITSEDVKNSIYTELTWQEAQSFVNSGGLVAAVFSGIYKDREGNVEEVSGHTVIVAPHTDNIVNKIDTTAYPGSDKFNKYPIVFHTGSGNPRIVTLNWAFSSGKRDQVRFVISTAEYNSLK
jgi:RHS repeat-associated protein